MNAILAGRGEILYGVAGAKNLELKRLVELGSLDAILRDFRAKEVKRFAFLEIRKRFEYLARQLKFDIDQTFRFDGFTDDAREALKHWNLDRLVAVYDQRHGVVHRDERPLTTVEDLKDIYEATGKLIIDLTTQATVLHNVLNDGAASIADLAGLVPAPDGSAGT